MRELPYRAKQAGPVDCLCRPSVERMVRCYHHAICTAIQPRVLSSRSDLSYRKVIVVAPQGNNQGTAQREARTSVQRNLGDPVLGG